jgi:N-acetylglucosamine malate deacetylase 1
MKIIAFGAHPDDIEPQIGGTLAKFSHEGADVVIVTALSTATGALSASQRELEGRAAAETLGAGSIGLGIIPEDFKISREYIGIFDSIIHAEKPNLIFRIGDMDSHHEHNIVYECVRSAARKNSCSLISLSQALPGGIGRHQYDFFSDISRFEKVKREAILKYESQIEKYGMEWVDAIIARDKHWGFNIGVNSAEAAFIDKWIV